VTAEGLLAAFTHKPGFLGPASVAPAQHVHGAERDAIDADRLKRENARRTARGLAPLANVAALDDAEAPDAVLEEAVEIAADAVQLPKAQEPARLS